MCCRTQKDSKDTEYWVLVESDDCRMSRRMCGKDGGRLKKCVLKDEPQGGG